MGFGDLAQGQQEAGGDVALGDRRDVATLAAAPAGAVNGAQIFAASCAACHQASGKGLPGVFPPLAGSSWVTDDPATLTQIVLHGMNGEIEVQGTVYKGAMPAFASQLSDAEMAAVLSYIRGAWGNSGAPIEADAVAAARTRTAGRTGPWSGPGELAEALSTLKK